ncbi:hypothetical protein GQ53DRAFT_740489 [Thozetella sp. PMI_491]|nr:hypothetical protein GQ53DRAFT_740489 [Thozetella sp. PMI_491]
MKERCEWIPNENQCERCARLQIDCQNIRPAGRPGRRPARHRPEGRAAAGSRPNSLPPQRTRDRHRERRNAPPAVVPRTIPELADVSSCNLQIVQRMLFETTLLDKFSVSTSFREPTREKIIPHLLLSQTTLQDGLLACAISWSGDVDSQANAGRLSSCYRHASAALAKLASLRVTDSQTMADCLVLGALVSTFAVRLRVNDVLVICSQTLGLIAPMYAASELPPSPQLLVFLSCMVAWELSGCLFGCVAPSFRFKPPTEIYVDRHVGLCATLLPLFHDLCIVSRTLAHGEEADAMRVLDDLERKIEQWHPKAPEGFTERYSAVDVAHMLCQAQIMRLAALLVAHRLRFPFGLNDAPAQALSMSILTQLDLTRSVTQEPVRCVTIPLLAACLELKDEGRRRWLPDVPTFTGFSEQLGKHVEDSLNSFWAIIDSSRVVSWHTLTVSAAPFLRHHQANVAEELTV